VSLSWLEDKLSLTLFKRKALNFNVLSLSKRERKSNYSVDNYFKDTLRAGPSKFEKAPKLPRAPKQIAMFVFPSLL
jgi:hypothetical protein